MHIADPASLRGTLYDPQSEHDACGIGFVADLSGRKSSLLVPKALEVLDQHGPPGCLRRGAGYWRWRRPPDADPAPFFRAAVLPGDGRDESDIAFLPRATTAWVCSFCRPIPISGEISRPSSPASSACRGSVCWVGAPSLLTAVRSALRRALASRSSARSSSAAAAVCGTNRPSNASCTSSVAWPRRRSATAGSRAATPSMLPACRAARSCTRGC